MSNSDIEDLSHETVAWRIAADKQEIPYESAYCRSGGFLSNDQLEWAQAMGARLDDGVETP